MKHWGRFVLALWILSAASLMRDSAPLFPQERAGLGYAQGRSVARQSRPRSPECGFSAQSQAPHIYKAEKTIRRKTSLGSWLLPRRLDARDMACHSHAAPDCESGEAKSLTEIWSERPALESFHREDLEPPVIYGRKIEHHSRA
jgi:hypothetical protein